MFCDSEIFVLVVLLFRFIMGVEGLGLGCGRSLLCGYFYSMEFKLYVSIGFFFFKYLIFVNINVVNDN